MSSGRILAQILGKSQPIFVTSKPKILISVTHVSQMTAPNPLIIIIWTCQEMMVWMSMELIGSTDVIW
jgi:hypothetical protein